MFHEGGGEKQEFFMNKKVVEKVKSAESSISLVLGIVVVIFSGVMLFKYFKNIAQNNTNQNTAENESQNTDQGDNSVGSFKVKTQLPAKYKVENGDNLWKISVKFYGYGYNWLDITKENKLTNPNNIEVGQELTIPNVPVRVPLNISSENTKPIEGNEYVVVKGDNLWNISVRAYQDGYKWVEIAKANNLSVPNQIEVGNKLIIPR